MSWKALLLFLLLLLVIQGNQPHCSCSTLISTKEHVQKLGTCPMQLVLDLLVSFLVINGCQRLMRSKVYQQQLRLDDQVVTGCAISQDLAECQCLEVLVMYPEEPHPAATL